MQVHWAARAAGFSLSVMLSACGGGGGGGDGPGGQPPPASTTLSDTQRSFEELMFSEGQRGAYALEVGSGSPARWAAATQTLLPASPAAAARPVESSSRRLVSLNKEQAVPASEADKSADPLVGTAFVEGGSIVFRPASASVRYSYVDQDVRIAVDGTPGGAATRIVRLRKVPLTGTLRDAPAEFRARYATLYPLLKSGARFYAGSAYYERTVSYEAEVLQLVDQGGDPATDPRSATPLSATQSLLDYVAARQSFQGAAAEYTLVKGVRCLANPKPPAGRAAATIANTTRDLLTQCEVGGKVYNAGYFPKGFQPPGTVYTGSDNVQVELPYGMQLNKAAIDSMQAALPGAEPVSPFDTPQDLSWTQKQFEEFALESRGGAHFVDTFIQGTDPATDTLRMAVLRSGYVLPSQPNATTDVASVVLANLDLNPAVPWPRSAKATPDNEGSAYVDGGRIVFRPANSSGRYTYQAGRVVAIFRASDGTVTSGLRVSFFDKIPLQGSIADLPAELQDRFKPFLPRMKAGVAFQPGAALYRAQSVAHGDSLRLVDADNDPTTDVRSATPAAVGALADYVRTAAGTFYTLPRTLKGVPCMVDRAQASGATTVSGACEIDRKVYRVTYTADGQTNFSPTFGTDSGVVPYIFYFNKAAADSVQAMLP